jgi:hypothetical protein
MWRAQAGANIALGGDTAEDDDWETDPDFVVRYFGSFMLKI